MNSNGSYNMDFTGKRADIKGCIGCAVTEFGGASGVFSRMDSWENYWPVGNKGNGGVCIMRKMKDNEIDALLEGFGWATLCMVDPGLKPYAVEFSYFMENGDICGLVHPRGKTAECLASAQAVCVKICDSDAQCRRYRAVSCFGIAAFEKLTNPTEVARAWDKLEEQLQLKNGEYSGYKDRYLSSGKALPLLRIMVSERTGVTSSPRNEPVSEKVGELVSAVD